MAWFPVTDFIVSKIAVFDGIPSSPGHGEKNIRAGYSSEASAQIQK